MKIVLQKIKRKVFHSLRLYPIYSYFKKIEKYFTLKNLTALEVFAYTGELQAVAYSKKTSYHEAWEIREECFPKLKKNLPKANVKIVDSFKQILLTDKKFNFINVDNHQGLFGSYCEHFEIFPLLFNVTDNKCLITINYIPFLSDKWLKIYPELFNTEHLKKRKVFYNTLTPENLNFEESLNTYKKIIEQNNYSIINYVLHKRNLMYYLGFYIERNKL